MREIESIEEGIKYAEALKLQLAREEEELAVLEKNLTKEQRDVHVLEREGVASIIRKIIGDREEKLEKEKEEYLKVSGRHIEIYKSIELLQYEIGLLKNKAATLDTIKLKMAILLREREKELMSSDPVSAALLKDLEEELIKHNTCLKKIEKTKATGSSALASVITIENYLIEARKQIISNKAGSALLVDVEIENARRLLVKVNKILVQFKKELGGIFTEINLKANIRLEKFDSYTAFSFNTASTFKEKINISRRNVKESKEQVEFYLSLIDHECDETRGIIAEVEEERRKIIMAK